MDFQKTLGSLVKLTSGPKPPDTNRATLIDRSLGSAATVGIAIVMYRIVSQFRRDCKKMENENVVESKDFIKEKLNLRIPSSIWNLMQSFARDFMSRMGEKFLDEERNSLEKRILSCSHGTGCSGCYDDKGNMFIIHEGSCHCKSITFSLKAPADLHTFDSSGKIRYPFFRSLADNFYLVTGSSFLSKYYVNPDDDDTVSLDSKETLKMTAHVFCSKCGVHILRAPDSETNILDVNICCLDVPSTYDNQKGHLVDAYSSYFAFVPNDCTNSEVSTNDHAESIGTRFHEPIARNLSLSKQNSMDPGPSGTSERLPNKIDSSNYASKYFATDSHSNNITSFHSAVSSASTYIRDTPATASSTIESESVASSSPSYHEILSFTQEDSSELSQVGKSINIKSYASTSPTLLSSKQLNNANSPNMHVNDGNITGKESMKPTSKVARDQLKYYMEKHLSPH